MALKKKWIQLEIIKLTKINQRDKYYIFLSCTKPVFGASKTVPWVELIVTHA